MKKYLALLLSMLLLVGCARIEPEQGGTKPEPGQPDDVSAKLLSQYALAEVKLPTQSCGPVSIRRSRILHRLHSPSPSRIRMRSCSIHSTVA